MYTADMAKAAFGFFVHRFETVIAQEHMATFYTYVYELNELASELNDLPALDQTQILAVELASYRRVLKLVLEQSCKRVLTLGTEMNQERVDNAAQYDGLFADLFYLGVWAYSFGEQVAEIQMIGVFQQVRLEQDGTIRILPERLVQAVRSYMLEDYRRHTDSVVLNKGAVHGVRKALFDSLRVDFDGLGQVLNEDDEHPGMTWGLMKLDMAALAQETGAEEHDVRTFYEGLTLSKSNVPSVADSILQPQSNHRMLYRPFLLLETEEGPLYLSGKRMWREAITSMLTNALPYEHGPREWLKHAGFREFSRQVSSNQDAVLEDAVESMIRETVMPYDRSVKSLTRPGLDNLVVKHNPGEMDFIVVDKDRAIVFVLECKHHRSRFDMVSWRREQQKFAAEYEPKLLKKVEWVKENLLTVVTHVTARKGLEAVDASSMTVLGAFVVNAPCFYLYDGQFDCFTLSALEK